MRTERYNIIKDKWEELAPLNQGRALHASCAFNQRHAFVFCGVEMPKGGLCCSIERLDMQDTAAGWKTVQIPEARNQLKRPRQVPAVAQISTGEIVIMGGFAISSALKGLFKTEVGGEDGLSDIYVYNVGKKSVTRIDEHGEMAATVATTREQ